MNKVNYKVEMSYSGVTRAGRCSGLSPSDSQHEAFLPCWGRTLALLSQRICRSKKHRLILKLGNKSNKFQLIFGASFIGRSA